MTAPSHLSLDDHTANMLLDRARQARENAYAPYSGFPVGAALLSTEGEVFTGCNVENASYSLTQCAERVAMGRAIADGVRGFRAVAVVGPDAAASCPPCGSCRQVLWEFGEELLVVTPGADRGSFRIFPIRELLPGAFGGGHLPLADPSE